MQPNTAYYADLLERYLRGETGSVEANELLDFIYRQPNQARTILEQAGGESYLEFIRSLEGPDQAFSQRVLERLMQSISVPAQSHSRRMFTRIGWAAAILLFLSAGIWLLRSKNAPAPSPTVGTIPHALPGGNRATLTLANGQKIFLDSAANGILAKQGNTMIDKLSNGQLIYEATNGGDKPAAVVFNTLSTPRGGQYQLRLPDGTRVWLNAASSISYPNVFTGADRMVSITGEAYFEVAHNASHPFKVKAGPMEITDVGTSFNINAYENEPATRTTLVEGAVLVADGDDKVSLSPGHQAIIKAASRSISIADADIDLATAWKNGLTAFKHSDIRSIMRQVERWYDLEVEYEGAGISSDRTFTGGISRKADLSDLLRLLEAGNIRFRIEGKRLFVKP